MGGVEVWWGLWRVDGWLWGLVTLRVLDPAKVVQWSKPFGQQATTEGRSSALQDAGSIAAMVLTEAMG
jgi:hypothetical protein